MNDLNESDTLIIRIARWIRQRLLEGFEALTAYRWARVIMGFFAFIGRSVYHLAGALSEKLSYVWNEMDADAFADEQIETLGGRIAEKGKRVLRRMQRLYASVYQKHAISVKMLITTCLLVLSMVLMLLRTCRTTALMCAGMGFSWLSDAMLMQYPPIRRGVRQYFLWGMGGFACAMACYIGAFFTVYTRAESVSSFVFYGIWAVFAAPAVVIWLCCIATNPHQLLVLRGGTLVYAMLVSAMAASASATAIATAGRVWWLVPGGVCFFISDMLIALFNFGSVRSKYSDGWIWLFYAPAQLLLLTGACAAAAIG